MLRDIKDRGFIIIIFIDIFIIFWISYFFNIFDYLKFLFFIFIFLFFLFLFLFLFIIYFFFSKYYFNLFYYFWFSF